MGFMPEQRFYGKCHHVLTTAIALAGLCFCVFTLLDRYNSIRFINVRIQNSSSVSDLLKSINNGDATLKVAFTCSDDEPSIKDPRYASDQLTWAVMSTGDECYRAGAYDAIIIVHTAPTHFQQRQRFRAVYADHERTKPWRLKVVFMLGEVRNATLRTQLELENMDFGDTVMGPFLDTYRNLSLKAVMSYRWMSERCSGQKLLIKMDDDVLLNVRKFFQEYWHSLNSTLKHKTIHCFTWKNAHVNRAGKWKIERNLHHNHTYSFTYCSGHLVVVTPDLIAPMYNIGKRLPFFWVDDIFIYGMIPNEIGNVHFEDFGINKRIALKEKFLIECEHKKGDKCEIFSLLTDNLEHFDRKAKELGL